MKTFKTLRILIVLWALLGGSMATWADYFPHYGETDTPYLVKTVEDLKALAADVNSGISYQGKTFSLDADLDFSSEPTDATGTNYTPIGTPTNPFKGSFNGQKHSISGIVINRTGCTDADQYNGVFGYATGFAIDQLELTNSTITGYSNTGGIAGYAGTYVRNCLVTNSVTINVVDRVSGASIPQNYGGIAGRVGTTIQKCVNQADVNAEGNDAFCVGGIVGQFHGSGYMNYCLNTGTVNGTLMVGGLIGVNSSTSDLSQYHNLYDSGACSFKAIGDDQGNSKDFYPYACGATLSHNLPEGVQSVNEVIYVCKGSLRYNADPYFFAFPGWDNYYIANTPSEEPTADDHWLDDESYYDLTWIDSQDQYGFYTISTAAQLAGLAYFVNINGWSFYGDKIQLSGDIDCSAHLWNPIGNGDHPFCGLFVGNGFTVSGIYVKSEDLNNGLFGHINTGSVVRDLQLANSEIEGGSQTGALVGNNWDGLVENSHVQSSVTVKVGINSFDSYGGIAGRCYMGTISGCSSAATITTDGKTANYVGGIAGWAEFAEIKNSLFLGEIDGNINGVGAIAGYNNSTTFTKNFYGGECDHDLGGVNSSDVDGTMAATESSYDPGTLGNEDNSYDYYPINGMSYISVYENGLHYGSYYYYDGSAVSNEVFPIYAGDLGTMGAPFLIKTPEDWNLLAEDVNVNGKNHYNHYFRIVNDLDFSTMPVDLNGNNYTPIGTGETEFWGTIWADGHTISGINLSTSNQYQGLFSFTHGNIYNLTLANSSIMGSNYTGGIAGRNLGTIQNCHVLSDVKIYGDPLANASCIGGIVGQNFCTYQGFRGRIIGCTNEGTIYGSERSGMSYGGIAGSCETSSNIKATIEDCLSIGQFKMMSNISRIGDILGYNGTMTSSENITGSYSAYPCPNYGYRIGNIGSASYDTTTKRAFVFDENPDAEGIFSNANIVKTYTSFPNSPSITVYNQGMEYNGKYYTNAWNTVSVTVAKTGYATTYNSRYIMRFPNSTDNATAQIVTAMGEKEGQLVYEAISSSNWEETGYNTIPAGTAVLLYYADIPGNWEESEFDPIMYFELEEPMVGLDGYDTRKFKNNLLYGSDVETLTTGNDGDLFYKLTFSNDETKFGWFWGTRGGGAFVSPAYKAWLALPAGNDIRSFYSLTGDNATGIAGIEQIGSKDNEDIYTLGGQRIDSPRRGIYVKGGKKVIIK